MVVCDGFNNLPTTNQPPFPRLPSNQLLKQSVSHGNQVSYDLNETPVLNQSPIVQQNGTRPATNGHVLDKGRLLNNNNNNNINNNSACNYDNLRDIETSSQCDSTGNNLSSLSSATSNDLFLKSKYGATSNGQIINNNNNQQAASTSLPITDKSLMNNIMNKSTAQNDPKSQSMFTNNNNTTNTPVSSVSPSISFGHLLFFGSF